MMVTAMPASETTDDSRTILVRVVDVHRRVLGTATISRATAYELLHFFDKELVLHISDAGTTHAMEFGGVPMVVSIPSGDVRIGDSLRFRFGAYADGINLDKYLDALCL